MHQLVTLIPARKYWHLFSVYLTARGVQRLLAMVGGKSFCHRHTNITLRAASTLSYSRAKASDPDMLAHYFDLLEKTLVENNLTGKVNIIFNIDESAVPLDSKPPKVVVPKGSHDAHSLGSGDKSQVTAVSCVSAVGFCMPPMVIWDRKTFSPELTVGEIPGTIYGLSSDGWMDQELFQIWFSNHFLQYASSIRPLLDRHSSHFCPESIQFASYLHFHQIQSISLSF